MLKIRKQIIRDLFKISILSQKKGTKAVTGAVPFQKVHFCT